MKKKNIIGHMAAPQKNVGGRLHGMALLPRAFCLLLAILIWLAVAQINAESASGGEEPAKQQMTEGDIWAE